MYGADALPFPPTSELPIGDPLRTLIENNKKSPRATTGNNTSTGNINQRSDDQSPASPTFSKSGSMFELDRDDDANDGMSSSEGASDDDNDDEKLDEGPPPRKRSVRVPPRKKKFRSEEKQKCDICGTVLANATNLRLHKRHVHEGLRRYACGHCEKKFNQNSALLYHLYHGHKGVRYYVCHSNCSERFTNHSTFKQHLMEKHNESADSEIYHCDLCPKSFVDSLTHQQHSHKPKQSKSPSEYDCIFCGKMFRMKLQLENHTRRHTGEMPFECHVCSESFFTRTPLQTHLLRKHDQAAFECGVCKKKYADKRSFQKHEETHGPNSIEIKCQHCSRTFANKLGLSIHMRSHTEILPHKCPLCPFTFSQIASLKMHQVVKHNDESITMKVFQCPDCGKKFSHSRSLNDHRRRFHGPGEFSCAKCGYTFDKERKLRIHQRRECGTKPRLMNTWREDNGILYFRDMEVRKTIENKYACPVGSCENSHATQKALAAHVRNVHESTTPIERRDHQCDQCGKTYPIASRLARHVKGKHEGGYLCDICGVSRTTQSSIDYHKRVDHQGIRPHICEHCGKAYGNEGDLIVHVRHHTGERPFVCDLCPKAFIKRTNLTDHQRTHHPEIGLPCSYKPARRRRKQQVNT